ncbi:MAG: hypothetical protein ACMUEM_00330 [Flavobacteriales bacterium AspAUS03]
MLNYEAFKKGLNSKVREELLEETQIVTSQDETIKWIIDTASIDDIQITIAILTQLIEEIILFRFDISVVSQIFIKTSSDFYPTIDGKPNGST